MSPTNPSAPSVLGTALLVEDDARLARLLLEYLRGHGVVVSHAADGEAGLREALAHRFDVVLLDLMLPGKNGLEVCQALRERSDVPIIMLTARGDEEDLIRGLEQGADDYVTKPFSPRELLARLRVPLRRRRGQGGPAVESLQVGPLHLAPTAQRATLDGRELPLTGYEFRLLQVLAERAGRVLSREELLDLAKGNAEDSFDRSIDVHISRLRQKLGDDAKSPRLLKTVRGAGYLLATQASG